MFNIGYYSDYLLKIASTRFGKLIYSVMVGAVGAVILVIFLANLFSAPTIGKLLPVIVGFNAILAGYMVIEKTKDGFTHRRTVAMVSGLAVVMAAALILNILFFRGTGGYLIIMDDLLLLLPVGIVTGGLGGMLAEKYFQICQNR